MTAGIGDSRKVGGSGVPWSKWKRRRIHARWWIADRITDLAAIVQGND